MSKILCVFYDTKNPSFSQPLIMPSYEIAVEALSKLNPSNFEDILVIPVCKLDLPTDLLRLRVDKSLDIADTLHSFNHEPIIPSSPIGDEGQGAKGDASLHGN